jgi:iron complex outermembrane receptor protein
MSLRLSATLAAFIAGVVLAGNPSSSQAQPTASVSGGDGLEETLVTASKNEERLQEVPASLTALSADTLDHAVRVDRRRAATTRQSLS